MTVLGNGCEQSVSIGGSDTISVCWLRVTETIEGVRLSPMRILIKSITDSGGVERATAQNSLISLQSSTRQSVVNDHR
jgi:hypothetical protein